MATASDFSAGLAAKLSAAAAKVGFEPADFHFLSEPEGEAQLRSLLDVRRGRGEVVVKTCIIDLAADAFIPEGYTDAASHTSGDAAFVWSPEKVRLHLSPNQQGGKTIGGEALHTELTSGKVPVFNANLLDGLLRNPHLIPEEWKKIGAIFFWGTIYRDAGGDACARYLHWDGDLWYSDDSWLGVDWHGRNPAAVLASQP